MKAEQITEPVAHHGEGAVWFDGWGGLRFVDMLAGDVLSLDTATGRVSRHGVGSPVAALVRPRRSGGCVIATERGFRLEDADGSVTELPPLWEGSERRLNEGGCDPAGGLYCGSMAYDRRPGGADLYRLDPGGRVEHVLSGVTISNGIGFSPDGATMYYVDSPTRRVDAFDVDGARIAGRRPFVHVADGAGGPDGLWVDEQGGVWVALYGGSAVHRYDPAGRLDEVVELPVTKVTSCTFGGADRSTLYVTTSREGLPAGEQPSAGAIFAAEVGIRGTPVLPFAG
ncbi:SMP-30/gluconolactonase/LRE family protein [Pseudonocardia alaniniphila]|uniref:SMP-30/gluconolactonase/LRE family protein n=1 Tax=Pseudonocardia alaniniphila TaxID=75291 RepID=A0ABS9TU33_9PSEU|nr:SMP-30/gluconolactonase/LRE family protein [Pseudonocardia alaniniphila]MCH6172070.1 SMP-30/gluconolactonase/LRE family protein [Pseudonocardia alaniniphila]